MFFNEITLGFTVETKAIEVREDAMIDFALQYDRIPLHTDKDYAKKTMFGDLIASGFYSALLVYGEYTAIHQWEGLIAGNMTKFSFQKPVYAGDWLRGVISVTKLTPLDPSRGVIEETMEVFNQNGVLVVHSCSDKFIKTRQT